MNTFVALRRSFDYPRAPMTAVDTPWRRRAGAGLLALYAAAVLFSGFAWPLGHGDRALWPFNRAWWMFHREDGYYYLLRFAVLYDDGRRDEADLDPWFTWPASSSTRRYTELSRDPATLRAFVRYLCLRHNRDARPADHWRAISISDTSYRQTRGRRVPFRQVPWPEQRVNEILHDEPCP